MSSTPRLALSKPTPRQRMPQANPSLSRLLNRLLNQLLNRSLNGQRRRMRLLNPQKRLRLPL